MVGCRRVPAFIFRCRCNQLEGTNGPDPVEHQPEDRSGGQHSRRDERHRRHKWVAVFLNEDTTSSHCTAADGSGNALAQAQPASSSSGVPPATVRERFRHPVPEIGRITGMEVRARPRKLNRRPAASYTSSRPTSGRGFPDRSCRSGQDKRQDAALRRYGSARSRSCLEYLRRVRRGTALRSRERILNSTICGRNEKTLAK